MKKLSIALAVFSVLAGLSLPASPAQAGNTVNASTDAPALGHASATPTFSVTVGDDYAGGTMSGVNFLVPNNWTLNTKYRSNPAYNNNGIEWTGPGVCGIQSVAYGSTPTYLNPGDFGCTFQASSNSSYRTISIRQYRTLALQVASPMTVTFMPGAFTAPRTGTSSNWHVAARNDEDPNGGGLPVNLAFALADVTVEPALQYVSCETTAETESKPLVTSGFDGAVTYSLQDEIPNGLTFDPVTGVIAGTPAAAVEPETVFVYATGSKNGQPASAASAVGLNVPKPTPTPTPAPLPDTGVSAWPIGLAGGALLGVGVLAIVASRRVAQRSRRK